MSIIIGADIVPTESNQSLFVQGNTEELLGTELLRLLESEDYRIANLEVPLTNQASPIVKNGPNLIAPTKSVAGLKAMGIDLLALANNHIMDQGFEGLKSTVQTLDQAGISHVGVGDNLREANAAFFFTVKGKRYGVYACAEHEFSIAGENLPGANPFDPLESPDHVSRMKDQCDYAIVLYHGGMEHYRYPSPNLQKACRKMVEKGADLVICQHSHCIGCEEKYLSGTIVYGQGNFILDRADNEYWKTGLLIRIDVDGQIEYIPLVKQNAYVRLAYRDEKESILTSFQERSKEIEDADMVREKYDAFAQEARVGYMISISGKGHNLPFRIFNKLSGYRLQKVVANHYRIKTKLILKNYIECEAHRELLLNGLGD